MIKLKSLASENEKKNRKIFLETFKNCPIPENELLANLGLFVKRQELTKFLFFYELYKKILDVHGIIIEFGSRWGQNLITLTNLRSILEPYNYSRKILGFDTFEGFKNTSEKDGNHEVIKEGAFSTSNNYEKYIEKIINYHETESPLSHIDKHEIIKGDAGIEFPKYLDTHPETIIAMAYFDFDIYNPTKNCLELIKNHITKGTIIGFDELNDPNFPGATKALKEVLNIQNYSIRRFNFCGIQSYLIVE